MKVNSSAFFHKQYGKSKPRIVYYKKDCIDYLLMLALSAFAISASYGVGSLMSVAGLVLCAFMLVTFIVRHGIELMLPVILRKPQDVFYMVIYKLRNLKPVYFVALGLLLLENVLIARTPNLPHHVELMRTIALYLFYIHFLAITVFRTAILVDHLRKKELVREVLMQTPWRRVVKEKTNMTLEIAHAYSTGLLTHIITIAPWYLVIIYSRFSVIFLPVTCAINVIIYRTWLKRFNAWFYRDHWLGHNSELEFVFLHGPHHDAIPSGMIAVGENGMLEGIMRFLIGSPTAYYNPVVCFVLFTVGIVTAIEEHQYIPGIFPRMSRVQMLSNFHLMHHYGTLEPYGIGTTTRFDQSNDLAKSKSAIDYWIPAELRDSITLDEELTGFNWDNPTYRGTLALWDKYQK